jgi:hypothetical protein
MNSWLYRLPPWRMPRIRTHHYHHGHHTERTPVIRWAIVAYLFAIVWMIEFEAWLVVWFYYGLGLALRWVWRHNPIGQTIDSRAARRARQQPAPYDPHGAPPQHYDLGNLKR